MGTLISLLTSSLKLIEKSGFPIFLPLICYEALFSNEILGVVKEARWILNITNDAWFGNGGGPKQHLKIARMRALENNIPLIRVSNNGISAVSYTHLRAHETS